MHNDALLVVQPFMARCLHKCSKYLAKFYKAIGGNTLADYVILIAQNEERAMDL